MKVFEMPVEEFNAGGMAVEYLMKIAQSQIARSEIFAQEIAELKAKRQNKLMTATDNKAPEILELTDQIEQREKDAKLCRYAAEQVTQECVRFQDEFLRKLIPSDTAGAKKAATDILNALEKEKKK